MSSKPREPAKTNPPKERAPEAQTQRPREPLKVPGPCAVLLNRNAKAWITVADGSHLSLYRGEVLVGIKVLKADAQRMLGKGKTIDPGRLIPHPVVADPQHRRGGIIQGDALVSCSWTDSDVAIFESACLAYTME